MAAKILNFQDYSGYIKCGEILKSPLPNYQYPFILKCYQCDKIDVILESFVMHIQKHCNESAPVREIKEIKTENDEVECESIENPVIKLETVNMEVDDPLIFIKDKLNTKNPQDDGGFYGNNLEGSEDLEGNSWNSDDEFQTDEAETEEDEEDPLVVIKDELIEEYIHDDADGDVNSNNLEDNEDFEDNSCDSDDDFNTDDGETDEDDVTNNIRNKKSKSLLPLNIEKFIKCKENMKTLIALYKNQPNLWNKDLPFYRFKDKRQTALEETTKELNDKLNLEMTWKEVSDIISYIYRKHRIDFRRLRRYEEERKDSKVKKYKRCWFFDDLYFLRPKPVMQLKKLDFNIPDLTTEQVIKIIQIYREFPHLWNSNLIEFICSNKRHAAHNEMLKSIETKMDIKISVTALEEYLRTLHYYFSREKCLRKKNIATRSKNRTEDYYEHLLYLYDHEGPFNCSKCKRVLAKPLLFKIHKASHDDSVPFICSQCNKEFKTMQSYTVHAKRHFEDLEYACSLCDKKFVAYGVLRLHLLTHTGDRPYCCEICGASYRQVQCLNRHKRRHEKRYSHVCQICSKGYYSKKTYEDHMNSHMNIRSHICQLCGKGFITSKALKTHAVTHEDARNHACKLCGKTFKLKIGVLQHMRTHGKRLEIDDKN